MSIKLSYWKMPSKAELLNMSMQDLQANLYTMQKEKDELTKEYNSGDPLQYSPDWYDRYVYPIESALWAIENAIAELDEEDSDEDSW
jgi:hypothetical protein